MPGFDKTGPKGQGPMTGGGRGFCRGGRGQGQGSGRGQGQGQGFGRGQGMGRGGGGRGRGRGRGFGADAGPQDTEDDVTALREQSEKLKSQLEEIENRLAKLRK